MNTASLCNVLPEGEVPESVQLLPSGPEIEGRDGRKWRLESAVDVGVASHDGSADLPIDYEHATEIKGPKGEPAPAVGWIKSFSVRNGELWGNVEWTMEGAAMVAARKYRYLSPVFQYDKESHKILRVLSAALTNQPNLRMAALNTAGRRNDEGEKEENMTQYEITREIKVRATKLLREMGGMMTMTEAVQTVAPEVMRDAASPAPPAVTHPSERASHAASRENAKSLEESDRIIEAARAYQREMGRKGLKVNNIEAVNHVTIEAAA